MKKRISLLLVFAMLISLLVPVAATTVSAEEPTLITNQAGLSAISTSGNYKLANDITISGTWTGIVGFTGTLDGDGHTITFADGVTITGGLFQLLNNGATVKNLNIVQAGSATFALAKPNGSGAYCFGMVAACLGAATDFNNTAVTQNEANKITIQNVTVTANIVLGGSDTNLSVGGIAGESGIISVIENCTFNGSIVDTVARTGRDMNTYQSGYGGIIGQTIRTGGPVTINQCVNNADVTAYGNQGGILGHSRSWSGGATALKALIITKCVNNGTITCAQTTTGSDKRATAGGIAGYVTVKSQDSSYANILNNINNGNVTGAGSGEYAYVAGTVACINVAGTATISGNINYGTLSGGHDSYRNNFYTKKDGSGTLIAANNYNNPTEDALATLESAYPEVFAMNNDKIALIWTIPGYHIHSYVDGVCTECGAKNYIEVTSQEDFAELVAANPTKKAVLANDITLSGTWNFTTPFTGEFDGAGYTITLEDGIEITGGLFCELRPGAYVHDLTIVQEGDATWNYYTGATGAQAGSIGAVAAYVGAAGNHDNLTYIVDASNKIRVENVTATVVIVEYDAVSGTDAAAIGGIIGEVGMYTEVKNCAASGMIYDDYDHSATNSYFSNNNVDFERSSYGGIVGLAFRKTNLLISECLNEAEITGSGLQGGILGGSPSCSNSERACNIVIERCLNKGTVTTNGSTTSSVAASIVGAVFSHNTTAYIQNNINVGSVIKGGSGYCGGIVAVIRRGQANKVFVRGNLQESDTITGNQIVTVETSSATTVFANNYGRGAGNSTYSPLSDAAAYQSAYETLNAAYPDVFAMYEGKVTLIWALPEGYHEHTWGEWIVDTAATCTEAGSKHRTCTQCDETENEEIPAGHNYNEDGVCTVCGNKNYGEITSQADFATLIAAGEFNKYKLANDITISGTWNFTTPFTGEFDGCGHTITFADGIVITGGLFCELQAGAYVHDLTIVQAGAATWNYYTTGNGAQTGSIGAVAAYVGAAGNGGTSSYITNAENKIRVENIDVTVNISESEAVSGSNEAAAIGGIVGEVGMYTEVKNCTVSGSITDTYDHSATNSYFSYSDVAFERSSYGGIVGLAFRKTNLLISECLNEASITGIGLQGGILGGTPSCSNSETACNIVVERCLNKGTITSNGSTTSSVAGGIVGAIFSHNTTAYVQNNINLGKIARAEGSSICAGLVAVIRRGQANKVFVLGNLQQSDAITGNQIVTVETSSATTTYTNNYGRGSGGSQYSALSDAAAYASAYETLNAAYPGVFSYDDTTSKKIVLAWTVHTGEWIVDVEATCTSVGSRHFVCETCGKTFVEEIPMIAHDWEEWTIDAEATCTAAGSKHRDCKNCEATEVEELPMIAHSFDENDICTVCGSKNYAEITNQENFVAQVTAGNVPKYILLNDITISGTWDLAVIFTGNFDGRGHTITFADGVVITGGLFQKLGAGAYVHDLIIVQAGDATWNYLAGATGATSGSIGGLAAFVTAGSDYETESYTMNAANKVRIENVTVTANIAVDTAVPAGDDSAAIGGIVGEMNLYTEITRCIFNGSITDTYDHSAINSAGGNSERSSYGGILGLTFRHGVVVITECMNNANITGLGQVGGILGAASPVWNGELTFTVTIQRCVNKGTIHNNGTDTNSSTGGIAGYVFIRNSNRTATILGNINYGTLGSDGAQHIGGMVGRLRRGTADTFRFIANLQISDDLGGGSQISRQTDGSSDITYQNNYGRGTGGSRYAPLTYTKNYIEAYLTLNELYPDTYVFRDKKVALKWTDTASFDDAMTGVVGAQLRDNAAEGKQDIRIVAGLTIDAAGLDTLESVGIEVIAYYGDEGEKNEKSGETGTIYESILAAGATITAEAVGFNYLYTMRITGVPSELGTLRLLVRTYHVAGEDTVYSDYAILSVNLTA